MRTITGQLKTLRRWRHKRNLPMSPLCLMDDNNKAKILWLTGDVE